MKPLLFFLCISTAMPSIAETAFVSGKAFSHEGQDPFYGRAFFSIGPGDVVTIKWDPLAMTYATAETTSTEVLWNTDAARYIEVATGCTAEPSFIKHPEPGVMEMPIDCSNGEDFIR